MVTLEQVSEICESFPGSLPGDSERFGYSVIIKGSHKGFCWSWLERIDPKKARIENRSVLAVRVPSLSAKEVILGANTDAYFTEPHYNGYPAVLVRLEEIGYEEMADLLRMAHESLTTSPKKSLKK